jgi:molybdopterin-guanine dinucleotide biosynthesis protein MobB
MRDLARSPAVLGVVGPSNVGKTSLLEVWVPALRAHGLAVGVLKHASHGFLADRPGKDSYRLYEAGAEAVALVSREQIATFTRRSGGEGESVSLAAALATLPQDLDLVLAEGFAWEPIPRVVLFASDGEERCERLEQAPVLQRIRVPAASPGERPAFSPSLIASLVEFTREYVRAAGRDRWTPTDSDAMRRH